MAVYPRKIGKPVCRELPDGEAVIVTADDTRAVVLNPVGAAVWHLISGRRSVTEIVAVIRERFEDVAEGQIATDVFDLIDRLAEVGVVEA